MSFEKALLEEVNAFRRNPAGYADKLEKAKGYFKDNNIWKHPKSKVAIQTQEGPKAFDDAIEFLFRKTTMSAPELDPSKGLNKIAHEFLEEFQKDAQANVPLEPVIKKYGTFSGNFRRFVQFGGANAEMVVMSLLVSDGEPNRENRESLLLQDLSKIGVAYGTHEAMRHCSVIVVATKFTNTVDPDDNP